NRFRTGSAWGERLFSSRGPGLSSSRAVYEKPGICFLATSLGSGWSRNRYSRVFSRTPPARERKFARQVPHKILHGTGRRVLRLRLRRSLISHYEGARRILCVRS